MSFDRSNGYPSYPAFSHEIKDALAMATKHIQVHQNGGSPFITVASMPEPFIEPQPEDVHLYHYHPSMGARNGFLTPRNFSVPAEQSKSSYVVIGTLEYGRLTAIDPMRSTPGISGVPSRVMSELMSVYGQLPNAMVIIMNTAGKFTIQAQLVGEQEQQQQQQRLQAQPQPHLQLPGPPRPQLQPQQVQHLLPPPPQITYMHPRPSPRPSPRKEKVPVQVIYVDEDLRSLIDIEEDRESLSSEDGDDHRERRDRRRDNRSQLQRKFSDLYRDNDERKEKTTNRDYKRGRDDRRNRGTDKRDQKNRDSEPKSSRKAVGIYALKKSND